MAVEYIFGARDPKTTIGTWEKALIIVKMDDIITIGFFDDNIDYVGYAKCDTEALNYYNKFISLGYIPMNITDIERTSGIIILNNTITNPNNILHENIIFKNIYKIFNFIKKYLCIC
jgi:hypothetical protein